MSEAPERPLGVVEAFMAVRDQCPSGAVQRVARQGLEAIQAGGADSLPTQAFFLLSAVRGWQGPVARRVKEALESYLAEQERSGAGGAS